MVHFLGEGKQATGAYRKSRGDAKLYELRNSVVNTTSERFYNSEKFKTLHPSILYYFMCKPHHPSVIIPDWHCRHWSMFGAKTLDKTLGWLRQSLAHDLAPNMVKLLCMYLIWFSMKHGIKTDSMFFVKIGMLFCINSFASNKKKSI